ncbi:NINE protein [Lactobacillus sp. S2-2]|uniref:TM2 domain-containing protein n=1 Tax=Lactobacillus sp. S2-2 TaxID=2692917 RepID=UPI001F30B2BC|nr:TM2 domain-containing protein [Lactobacillus sp. S2-2]MCF6515580.1 NINE protein [Lactobacillus sp. S2-2]
MDITYEKEKIKQLESELTTEEQLLVETRVQNETREPLIAWLLWFFLGRFGAHRFYMKKPYAGLMLGLEIAGWITSIILIGFVIIFAMTIWWIIDAFNMIQWINEEKIHTRKVILESFIANKNN